MKSFAHVLLAVSIASCGGPGMDSTSQSTASLIASYVWRRGGIDGGGFGNSIAVNPSNPTQILAGGDVWGEFISTNSGHSWEAHMAGAGGIGAIYGRGTAWSLKNPSIAYACTGTLKTIDGYFVQMNAGDYQWKPVNHAFNCGSSLGSGAAGNVPRPSGRLIQVALDSSGTEFIYLASSQGLARSANGGSTFKVIGPTAPNGAWAALSLSGGALYAATYRTSATGGSTVYRIANPSSAASLTTLTNAPGVVSDLKDVGGTLYAAAGLGGVYAVTANGGTWAKLGGNFFANHFVSSVDGVGQTLYAGVANPPLLGHSIAKSTDGGSHWTWVTGASNVSNNVLGRGVGWWLGSAHPNVTMGQSNYDVQQLAINPQNANEVYSVGRSGVWKTENGGATWQPAVNGLSGTEVNNVVAGTSGSAYNSDQDWVCEKTSDHYVTVVDAPGGCGAFDRPALSKKIGTHTYTLTPAGSGPATFTIDGTSVGDALFEGAVVNPTDIAVSSDGYLYVAQKGGGVLVGAPQ